MSEVVGGSPVQPPGPGRATAGRPAPPAVRSASILMYVVAGLAVVQGLLSFVASTVNRTRLASALLAFAFALAYVVVGGRVRQGDRVARMVALALSGLSLLGDVLQLGANPLAGIVGLLLNGGIVVLLAFSPTSRRFFGTRADSGSG